MPLFCKVCNNTAFHYCQVSWELLLGFLVSQGMFHVQSLLLVWQFSQLLSPELHLSASRSHHTLGLTFVLIITVMIHLGMVTSFACLQWLPNTIACWKHLHILWEKERNYTLCQLIGAITVITFCMGGKQGPGQTEKQTQFVQNHKKLFYSEVHKFSLLKDPYRYLSALLLEFPKCLMQCLKFK